MANGAKDMIATDRRLKSWRDRRLSSPMNKSQRIAAWVLCAVLIGLTAASSVDHLAFVLLALIPTVTAAVLERPGQRAATISISSLTIATALPLVLGAALGRENIELLNNMTAWMFIAAAVAGGLLLFLILPVATVWLDDLRSDARVRALKARQAAIEREWGEEVRVPAAPAPAE